MNRSLIRTLQGVGWIALRRIPKSGKLGRGRAWFGIIVGGLSLAPFTVVVLAAN